MASSPVKAPQFCPTPSFSKGVESLTDELLAAKKEDGNFTMRALNTALALASNTGALFTGASEVLGHLGAPFNRFFVNSSATLKQASEQYDLDQKLDGLVQNILSNRVSHISSVELEHLEEMATTMSKITQATTIERSIGSFADIYHDVTQEIVRKISAGEYQSEDFMKIMSYEFGRLFFEGIAFYLQRDLKTPKVWQGIMDARYKSGIDPQIAASAGIAAHVIRDLPVALARTLVRCKELGITFAPQAIISDYDSVNDLLAHVQKMRYEKAKVEKRAGLAFELEATSPALVIKLIKYLRDGALVDGVKIFQQLSVGTIEVTEKAELIAQRDKLGAGLIQATLAAPTGNIFYRALNRLLSDR